MASAEAVYGEINKITAKLIRLGLSDEQNFPSLKSLGDGIQAISVSGGVSPGVGFGRRSYRAIYADIRASKSYNVRLLDGGLLLLQYTFRGDSVASHRLAYWASPTLETFQNEPELYETDELYLDFLEPSAVPFPIRFDYNSEEPANLPIIHPRCHMTLGQYLNCRIPVCSPLAPSVFVDFILRNFYSSTHRRFASIRDVAPSFFDISLYDEELSIPHLTLTSR
jgi:hypothetical protein